MFASVIFFIDCHAMIMSLDLLCMVLLISSFSLILQVVCADLVACSAIYKLLTINIQASLLHESFMGLTSI